jgi:hypothetical protein
MLFRIDFPTVQSQIEGHPLCAVDPGPQAGHAQGWL